MNIEQLRGVIARNMALDPNDDFGTEKCWEEMTAILSEDIIATLHYFENECTDEELYWLGAVFEDGSAQQQAVADAKQRTDTSASQPSCKGHSRNILPTEP